MNCPALKSKFSRDSNIIMMQVKIISIYILTLVRMMDV
jgi:hypothetical protein